MIGVNALTLRARLVKPHNQIDTGFIRLINEPAVVGRPQFQAITGVHFMTGIALLENQFARLQPDKLARQRIRRSGHRDIASRRQLNLNKIDGQIGAG